MGHDQSPTGGEHLNSPENSGGAVRHDLATLADQVWSQVALSDNPNIFPGFDSRMAPDGKVEIARHYTPRHFDMLQISQRLDGTWIFEQVTQRPVDGDIGYRCPVVQESLVTPLSQEPVTHKTILGELAEGDVIVNPEEKAELGGPADEQTYARLLSALRGVTDEQPIVEARPRRSFKGWLKGFLS